MKNLDFSFDKSGQFMLAQVYLLGAALQIDRYNDAINQTENSKLTGLFRQMHEVSCLLEDLACIAEYYKSGSFNHKLHKLWKQTRHHIRHDVRDVIVEKKDRGMTNKRHKYLKVKEGLTAEFIFDEDFFIIGGTKILIEDIKGYLDWANSIFSAYVEYSRETGHLRSGEPKSN